MSRIKKTSPLQNLSNFQTFIVDNNPLSQYFKISELGDLFTAGKNGFLIEGSTFLKPSTEIKIEKTKTFFFLYIRITTYFNLINLKKLLPCIVLYQN